MTTKTVYAHMPEELDRAIKHEIEENAKRRRRLSGDRTPHPPDPKIHFRFAIGDLGPRYTAMLVWDSGS